MRALVPALRELRPLLDDAAEGGDGARPVPLGHLGDALLELRIDLGVPGPAPYLPEGLLAQRADDRIGIAERLDQRGDVFPCARPRPSRRRPGACLPVGLAETRERLLARQGGRGLGRRAGGDGQREGEHQDGERSHPRPTRLRNCASSSTGTLSRRASSALLPDLPHHHVVRLLGHGAGDTPAEPEHEVPGLVAREGPQAAREHEALAVERARAVGVPLLGHGQPRLAEPADGPRGFAARRRNCGRRGRSPARRRGCR